jgi:hypothetical protein
VRADVAGPARDQDRLARGRFSAIHDVSIWKCQFSVKVVRSSTFEVLKRNLPKFAKKGSFMAFLHRTSNFERRTSVFL